MNNTTWQDETVQALKQGYEEHIAKLEKENAEIAAAHIESIEAMKASHKADIETYKAEQNFLGTAISTLTADVKRLKREAKQFEQAVTEDERADKNEIIRLRKLAGE